MLAAMAFLATVPLLKAVAAETDRPDTEDADLIFHRKQLQQIERDESAGMISQADADILKAELARRALHQETSTSGSTANKALPKAALYLLMTGIPLASLSLYLWLGKPDWETIETRNGVQARQQIQIDTRIRETRSFLEANPDNIEGWRLLLFLAIQKGDKAGSKQAFEALKRLEPDNPQWR